MLGEPRGWEPVFTQETAKRCWELLEAAMLRANSGYPTSTRMISDMQRAIFDCVPEEERPPLGGPPSDGEPAPVGP